MTSSSHAAEAPYSLASAALAFLKTHGLPPIPRHFSLAYLYCEGTHADLRREIDNVLAGGGLTAEAAARIHESQFGLDRESGALRKATETIERTLERVLSSLGSANREVASYGEALAAFSGHVDSRHLDPRRPSALTPEAREQEELDLRTALEIIRDQTRMMQARAEDLGERFTLASREVIGLRRDLDDMRVLASTDSLTGVANRKTFDMRLSEAIEEAEREDMPMALILADIDHFKAFNDTWGHQTGDLVLRLVARTMADCVRGRDLVARYGGEEFAVILPQTDLAGAVSVAENIRKTISGKRLSRKATGENLGMVTLSFGIARLREGEPPASLIGRADKGLYLAKQRGRNRIEMPDALAPGMTPGMAGGLHGGS